MSQLPYINIHKHSLLQFKDEIAISNIFAHDLPKNLEKYIGSYSVGIHPWHINEADIESQLLQIEKVSQFNNVLAIGEIGLDRLTSASM